MKSQDPRAALGDTYKIIFDSINDGVFIHDPVTGAVLEADRKAAEMHVYPSDEIRTITLGGIGSGSDPYTREGAVEKIGTAVGLGGKTGQASAPVVCKRKDGSRFWVDVSFSLFRDTMGNPGAAAVVRDVAERRRAEERRQERER